MIRARIAITAVALGWVTAMAFQHGPEPVPDTSDAADLLQLALLSEWTDRPVHLEEGLCFIQGFRLPEEPQRMTERERSLALQALMRCASSATASPAGSAGERILVDQAVRISKERIARLRAAHQAVQACVALERKPGAGAACAKEWIATSPPAGVP